MPDLSFPKQARLLNSGHFQPVFQQARFKVSRRHFLALAIPNSHQTARLGVVVSKKSLARAVQRNRVKRQLREAFRHRRQQFATIDLVILARQGLRDMSNQEIRGQIEQLLDGMARKIQQQGPKS